LDPVVEDPLEGQAVLPPPPVEVDGEEEYQLSSVEDSRVYRNQLQYLIRWTDNNSVTWQPAKFIDGRQPVEEFHRTYPEKPGPLENALGGPRAEGGDTVTVLNGTKIPGSNGGVVDVVWTQLCHGKRESLGDADEAA
jgi:hypothetical protein